MNFNGLPDFLPPYSVAIECDIHCLIGEPKANVLDRWLCSLMKSIRGLDGL